MIEITLDDLSGLAPIGFHNTWSIRPERSERHHEQAAFPLLSRVSPRGFELRYVNRVYLDLFALIAYLAVIARPRTGIRSPCHDDGDDEEGVQGSE